VLTIENDNNHDGTTALVIFYVYVFEVFLG